MATDNGKEAEKSPMEPQDSVIEHDYIASHLTKPIASSGVFAKGTVLAWSWMGALTSQVTLKEMVLLGSHDSAAFKGKLQSQDIPISEQLRYGVRLLDLQVATHENDIWLFYGEACALLGDILMEIQAFVTKNPSEKIIVVMRDSKTAPTPVNWSDVKKLFELGFSSQLVPKEDAGATLSKMRGSVVLVAPAALELEHNWGEGTIIHHQSPDTTSTLVGLHDHLQELSYGALDKKEDKIVWVECRSREAAPKRRTSELQEVQQPSFFNSSDQLFFNVISFSFIDKGHFSLVKDYFLKWKK